MDKYVTWELLGEVVREARVGKQGEEFYNLQRQISKKALGVTVRNKVQRAQQLVTGEVGYDVGELLGILKWLEERAG